MTTEHYPGMAISPGSVRTVYRPQVRSGKFHAGKDCTIGENVVVDVAEECVIGDRCVIPDNAYLCGRRIEIGNDFFGYTHWNRRLEVGLGRRDDEFAILKVGSRCTFHDNRIDLAREVTIGDDVGLSPEVTLYTHFYWLSELEGFPVGYAPIEVKSGAIIGYRSTLLPGCVVGMKCVVGAGSIVKGHLADETVNAGNPAQYIRHIDTPDLGWQKATMMRILDEYKASCEYRKCGHHVQMDEWPIVKSGAASFDVKACKIVSGHENDLTDDLRDWLFRHGIRIYTQRPFRKLSKVS